jgi:hypothetical protein
MPAPLLAAPLVIPFAEAIGVSIAALGMAKAVDTVNEYIQENPEESMKILSTIVPNIGIGQIFANKEDSGDEEVSETEEVTESESGSTKDMVLEELNKEKGNYSDPNATGNYASARGRIIGRLRREGKIRQGNDPNYDPSKKFQGYKRFIRPKKADGGAIGIEVLFEEKKPRKDFNTGGRATTQDFANALQRVSAGTTYQQQRQAKDYARQEASNLLSQAMRSGNQGNIQSILQGVGGITSIPGMQFNRSGNRITSVPATGAGRDAIINAMANQMLNTTSYGGGSSAPPQKSPLQLKIEENKRLYDEYVKNNAPQIGLLPGSQGGAPTPPKPEYEDQALLSKLTMLTPEEAFAGETFDTLSDLDQYNFAQAFSQFQPQLRDSSYVSPYGAPSGRDIFSRRYGIKDGGRVGLFMGGPALEGPALGIYNSMKAYQSFTDQEIANAIKEAGYELPTSSTPPDSSTPSVGDNLGITNNDRSVALPIGSVTGSGSGLIGDYMAATQERQNRLTNPNKVQSFINKFTGGGQADIGEMIRTGQIDTRKTSGIPLGISGLIANILPDKYYDMSLGDQVFTQSQMGYTGPTVFGENPTGNYKDPFGLNTRSAFGNYAEAVGKNFDQLRGTLTKDREGVTFNEETGLFEGVNADAVNKKTEMIRNKYNFRKKQLGVKNVLDSQIKSADAQRERDYAAALEKARLERIAKQQIADAEKAARQVELNRRQAIADAQKAKGQTTSGGRGNYRSDRDHSGSGGYGGSDKRSADNRSSDLGFSDIRLKENVELIGKSPSNINIYRFNYKDNPTTYQGAMAHEVPWASVKHSNGYMMIDYNQIDVDFKKI